MTKSVIPNSGYYNAKRDISFACAPYIIMGLGMKPFKKDIRHANLTLNEGFKHRWDDYVQWSPLALTYVLKVSGVQNRSKWGRMLVSNAFAGVTMAALVNAAKYSFKEMRPDGTTRNSFPSGHTATAFMCATILHKEYGLTRSPLYSIAGYGAATTIATMRVLNNRHWVSDVMVGAGIGILSTEVGYFMGDLIFKNKHIIRMEKEGLYDFRNHPSYFNLLMGPSLALNNLPVPAELTALGGPSAIKTGFAVTAGAEIAKFFNPYVGIGGRVRVTSTPVRPEQPATYGGDVWNYGTLWNDETKEFVSAGDNTLDPHYAHSSGYYTDQFSTFDYMGGVYGQLPLSKRWAVGGKLLFGGASNGHAWFEADVSGRYENADAYLLARSENLVNADGSFNTTYKDYDYVKYLDIDGHLGFTMGAGVNVTYAYKKNMLFKLGVDWDLSRNHYTYTYMDAKNSDLLKGVAAQYQTEVGEKFTGAKEQMGKFMEIYDNTDPEVGELSFDVWKTMHSLRINLGVAYSF